MNIRHPARTMPFSELMAGMEAACSTGMVRRELDHATGRVLYCYTNKCVYNNGWDDFALMARGLILHPKEQRIIATPFTKFFNVDERGLAIPDLPFETYEKLDGSLAIIHHYDGQWRAATKGAFNSSQANWAQNKLQHNTDKLKPGTTYLAEAIYPENRIVIRYDEEALVMLTAYTEEGFELPVRELSEVADALGWRTAQRYSYSSFSDLISEARALPKTSEGYVLRFANGLRLKVKGNEYQRIHALISRCTPLGVWEALAAGDDLEAIRQDLPEEFWNDFDSIVNILRSRSQDLIDRIGIVASTTLGMSDKEVGLILKTYPEDVRPFLFPWRRFGRIEGKTLQTLYRTIRPTADVLEGYTPSYAIHKVMDDI